MTCLHNVFNASPCGKGRVTSVSTVLGRKPAGRGDHRAQQPAPCCCLKPCNRCAGEASRPGRRQARARNRPTREQVSARTPAAVRALRRRRRHVSPLLRARALETPLLTSWPGPRPLVGLESLVRQVLTVSGATLVSVRVGSLGREGPRGEGRARGGAGAQPGTAADTEIELQFPSDLTCAPLPALSQTQRPLPRRRQPPDHLERTPSTMSRDPEIVNKITEDTYKNVMEQFNPGLRNLVVLGKSYEKAVTAMVQAGRAYYDGVAKVGEMTRVSQVSKELGLVLVEISNAHKKLNDGLEESFRKFHKEIISELEKKTDQDAKYMNATLKKYQTEHRIKVDSLERSQTDLKKLRRKSQGVRNAAKYDHKEAECLESINSRQSDIQRFIAEGCKEALLEEKRRFCFMVDKHCNFSLHLNHYHVQAADLLSDKLSKWQETCSDATKVPDTVVSMMQEIKTPNSIPISGTPQPSPMMERSKLVEGDYDSITKSTPKLPPAPPNKAHTSPLVDMFNNSETVQKMPPYQRLNNTADNPDEAGLPRSMSVATGLNLMKRSKVKTVFPHTVGNNKTLLSFAEGDIITLLMSEEKDGWLYGEHDITKLRGWFPSSYTRMLPEPVQEPVHVPSFSSSPSTIRSISTVNLIDRSSVVLPPPDYFEQSSRGSTASTVVKAPPPSLPDNPPPKPNANGIMKPLFLSGENPFATVKLRPTVTNDRSAPIIR